MREAPFKTLTIGFRPDISSYTAVAVKTVCILLLGSVELWVGEERAALGGRKQRELLALLALEPGQTVSRDRAAEALWGESLQEVHTQRLHTVLSRLRAAVRNVGGPADIVETTEAGYRLRVDPRQVDAARAAAALREARALRAEERLAEASAAARSGLDLWRGPPLADLTDNGWAGDALRRLEDLRLSLLEEESECRLALDPSPGLVEALETACASAPLRERLHAQLVLALDATGRRGDSLLEYDRVRRRLSEELGIEPGTVLREALRTVLAGEPVDKRPPTVVRRGRRALRPSGRVIGVAALVSAALAATAGVLVGVGGSPERGSGLRLPAGELVIADSGLRRLRTEIPLSGTVINGQPGGLVLAEGSLWSVTEQGTVTQVDLGRDRIVASTPLALPVGPGGMAVGLGAAWITDSGSPTVYRLASGISAARRIRLPPLRSRLAWRTGGVAVGDGSLWVVREAGAVDRLAPDGRLEHRFHVPGAKQIVGDGRGMWVVSGATGVVTKLDPRTNTVLAQAQLLPFVCCLAVGGGSVWATSRARGLLWQLRPDGTVEDVVDVPPPANEVAYARGAVWISGTSGTVTRVDARTLHAHTLRTGQPVAGMAAAHGIVAFSTFANARAALAGVRGPVARIVLGTGVPADTDPATPGIWGDRDADWQQLAATCLSLYEFRGRRLVPQAAGNAAVISSHGRVWTFRIRRGFEFSPPSYERVDARTFAATIERSTAPELSRSEAATILADVDGMNSYRRGLAAHIRGVEAVGDRLTIHLRHPVADLDARLAAPYFCAVPRETPLIPQGLQAPIPSAGPYYVAAVSGGVSVTLLRNPSYPGRSPAGFDAFAYELGVDPRRALNMVERGEADYAAFYGDESRSVPTVQRGTTVEGVTIRPAPQPEANRAGEHRKRIVEVLGRRLGCRSYSLVYAGVELKRLCLASATR